MGGKPFERQSHVTTAWMAASVHKKRFDVYLPEDI